MNLFVWKYFDFLLSIFTSVFTLLKQLSNTKKFYISREVYKKNLIWRKASPGGGVPKKKFFRERPPQKEWGGFQRGVKPPKNLCKFNSIMPANAKHACKCRKQCHKDKYRPILQRILKVSMLFSFQTWPFLLLKYLLITSIFLSF